MKYFLLILIFSIVLYAESANYKYDIKYFKQKVDHFGYTNEDTFQQRYFINSDYYNPDNGAIFFYTGNEGNLEMFSNNTGFIWENAPVFNALIVFAEHRYYGKSLPYGDKSFTDNKYRGYLTSEQALADYAYLIQYLRTSVPGANEKAVISFGGSYGGMLAAWIRMKYPHLVNGAVASSAPILQFQGLTPCEKFNEIVTQDFASVDSNCAKTIRLSWSIIRDYSNTEQGANFLTKTFRLCDPLSVSNVTDLIDWLDNTWVFLAMTDYPYPTNFINPLPAYPINVACGYLKNVPCSKEDLVINIFKAASVFQNYTGDVKCFDIRNGGDSALGTIGWDYQACTEMVMPMCQNGITDMFEPSPWNFTAFSEQCWKTWHVKPNLYKTLIMYGGKNITSSSNIVFTNGKLDPWSSGGVLESLSDTLIAILIDDAAHHLDLRSSNAADPPSVTKARNIVKSWIYKWIIEARKHR